MNRLAFRRFGAVPTSFRSQGIALIAVLWLVAALSLIVAGLVKVTRQDARMVGLSKQSVQAQALGAAAIQIVLQKMQVQKESFNRYMVLPVLFQGLPMEVAVMPMTGLINVNGAPAALLSQVFSVAGRVPPGVADELAQRAVEKRDRPDPTGQIVGFDAPEDLLQVPGIGFDLYANISGLLMADKRGSGRVNALAAPPEVLAVLSGGDLLAARQMAQARDVQGATADLTRLNPAFVDTALSNRFRLQVSISVDGGRQWLVTRDVALTPTSRDGLPWRIYSADARIVPR